MRYVHDWETFALRTEAWASIDKELCELVDRLGATGYRHTLEAELRLTGIKGDRGEYDFAKFLPEFREKGAVTIVDVTWRGDQLLHSSAHNH